MPDEVQAGDAAMPELASSDPSAHTTTNRADLVLDLDPDADGKIWCGYYFVDHQSRSVFWLDPKECCHKLPVWSEIEGTVTLAQLGMSISTFTITID